MKVLVIGGDGMAGHRVVQALTSEHDVWATTRGMGDELRSITHDYIRQIIACLDVRDFERVADVVLAVRPQVVINCAGIVKQRVVTSAELLEVNAVFPHRLTAVVEQSGARLIHLSTDCVFSGRRGNYSEADVPDPLDLYGISKLAGEPGGSALTLRTSIIGLELRGTGSLIEWALAQHGRISGFTGAIFSGVTTAELARVLLHLVTGHPHLAGVWHLAAQPISKFELLTMLFERLPYGVEVVPDASVACDRSLDGSKLSEVIGYRPPDWNMMIDELAEAVLARDGQR